MHKFLITLVVQFTALFITLDAAPVLSSAVGFGAAGGQHFSGKAKIFLDIFSNAAGNRAGRDSSIQADIELWRTFISNFLSTVSKKAALNDEEEKTLLDGVNSVLSFIGSKLDEDDEIQEVMKIITNGFGTLFLGMPKNFSDEELGRAIFNFANSFLSSMRETADPNNEIARTYFHGFKTIFRLFGKLLEEEGGIQSRDGEMKQAFVNLATGVLSGIGKMTEAHSANIDETAWTFLNIMKIMSLAQCRNANPNEDLVQKTCDMFDTLFFLSAMASDGELRNEKEQTLLNQFRRLFSTVIKRIKIMTKNRSLNNIINKILSVFD